MSYLYLATPYSKFPGGNVAAFTMACRATAKLLRAGIDVYSPVVHCHAIAIHGGIDPFDWEFWMNVDRPFVEAAAGLIVYRIESWELSAGIAAEIADFERVGKPVLFLDSGKIDAGFVALACAALVNGRAAA
jgi:hypothetical protein